MQRKKFYALIFCLCVFIIRAQNTNEYKLIRISEPIGDSADLDEKINYGLFPYFKNSEFNYACLFQRSDNQFVLESSISDSVFVKNISSDEVTFIKSVIEPRMKDTVNIERQKPDYNRFNTLSLCPLNLIVGTFTAVKIQFVTKFNRRLSSGLQLKYFINDFRGLRLSPFLRFYPLEKFYLYGSAHYSYHFKSEVTGVPYSVFGPSGGFGINVFKGKRRNFFMDFWLGAKKTWNNGLMPANGSGLVFDHKETAYFLGGPGAAADAGFSIGFRL